MEIGINNTVGGQMFHMGKKKKYILYFFSIFIYTLLRGYYNNITIYIYNIKTKQNKKKHFVFVRKRYRNIRI